MNIPTIIIGLGGIGSEIVENIERQMRQSSMSNKCVADRRNNVKFVIIDTDINSIREIEENGYQGYSVRLSDNVSVSNCMESNKEELEKWFPDNKKYYRKSLAEGAGQVRSISRLALQRAIRSRRLKPLYDAINDLHKPGMRQNEQEIKIAIVSTIAGGTGSGVILPLGIHIQDYLNRVYSGENAKINAFLILPDVLYDVIPSNKETRNLNANGYATIKEIDAFMKNDMPRISITLPNEENDTIKEFWDSPFDFCFLFNRLSITRGRSGDENNEDYKNIICRCLYTQYLGAFAKEYFSREDNVFSSHIRKVGKNKFFYEQFAGAGYSVLRYPMEEIREYLSLCWMLDIIEKEWIKYDKKRMEIWESNQKGKNIQIMVMSEGTAFLDAVKEVDNSRDRSDEQCTCETKQKEICERTQSEILSEIKAYISERIKQERNGLEILVKRVPQIAGHSKKKDLKMYLDSYIGLKINIEKENEQLFAVLSDSICREICSLHLEGNKKYYLEQYLKNVNGGLESPDYIRFYLYSLDKDIDKKKESLVNIVKEQEEIIENELKIEEQTTISKMRESVIRAKIQKYYEIYTKMDNLLEMRLEYQCIGELQKYIRKISENYERFFGEYSRMISLIKRHKREMENRFSHAKLNAEHWVYADCDRLQEMHSRMQLQKAYYFAEGEISKWLFEDRVNGIDKKDKTDMVDKYKPMKEKWEKAFDDHFFKNFNMNVLDALKREAEKEQEKKEGSVTGKMRVRIKEAQDDAAVKVSACRKQYTAVRKYCIYPPEILNEKDCDEIISEFFKRKTALEDVHGLDVNERKIVFIDIAYGFLFDDIDFFADDPGEKADYPVGQGISSYEYMVKNFCDNNSNIKLTPHIDKRWHKIDANNKKNYNKMQSAKTEIVLIILYLDLAMDSTASVVEKEFKKKVKEIFDQYYGIDGQNLIDKMNDLIKERKTALRDLWSGKPEECNNEVEVQIEKIHWIHEMLLEEWYSDEQDKEYLKDLKEDLRDHFFAFLEMILEIKLDWLKKYRHKWREKWS